MSATQLCPCEVRCLGMADALAVFTEAQTTASVRELTGGGDAAYYLRQVAVQSAVAEWMRIGATIDIHRALVAGAPASEVAHVVGVSVAELAPRWRAWADGQRRLAESHAENHAGDGCGLGMARAVYEQVTAVLAQAVNGDALDGDLDRFSSCSCRARTRK